jgi:hypothetical protein
LKEHSTHIIQKKNIFIVGSVWPEPQSSAAGWRMIQLINGFKNEGYEIFFASAANDSLNSIDFEKESIVKINIRTRTYLNKIYYGIELQVVKIRYH